MGVVEAADDGEGDAVVVVVGVVGVVVVRSSPTAMGMRAVKVVPFPREERHVSSPP